MIDFVLLFLSAAFLISFVFIFISGFKAAKYFPCNFFNGGIKHLLPYFHTSEEGKKHAKRYWLFFLLSIYLILTLLVVSNYKQGLELDSEGLQQNNESQNIEPPPVWLKFLLYLSKERSGEDQ